MTFRRKLLAIFALTVFLSVGAVAWLVLALTRNAFEKTEDQRTAALVTQFQREFMRRGEEIARRVQAAFSTQWFRVYTNDDAVGVELAGATKNVIAIAAGILDGLAAGGWAKPNPRKTKRTFNNKVTLFFMLEPELQIQSYEPGLDRGGKSF